MERPTLENRAWGTRNVKFRKPVFVRHLAKLVTAFLHEAAEETDLAGVVDVVKGDAIDAAHDSASSRTLRGFAHGRSERAVLAFEQFAIGAPRAFRRFSCCGALEKVAALERERSPFSAFDLAAHSVLPVSGVKGQLPNVVRAWSGPPSGLCRGDAANGLAKIRPVPRLFFVRFVDQRGKQVVGHSSLLQA